MAIVTSAFQGITTPVQDLFHEIHQRGWQVKKVDVKDGEYVAEVTNPHGESVSKVGRDASTALAAALMYIMRREHIRQGAWTQHWADQLESIAQSYAKAPVFDPKAAAAWKELADDCVARAAVLAQQVQIELTHDPEPYHTPQEMWEDVQKNKHLTVSDAATDHPVWTTDQVIAFRIVHDILGHAAAGGDFGWTGENLATAAHMEHLSPNAQRALFAETVGQAAYSNHYKGFGPQKICFLDDHLQPLQDAENPLGHAGEHPQMSLAPGPLPARQGGVLRDPNYQYDTGVVPPMGNAITLHDDPLEHMKTKDLAHALDTRWHSFTDHKGKPDFERMKATVMNALRAAMLSPMKELRWNAVHYQDISHIPYHTSDPKVYWDALENARINHNRAQGAPDPEIRHKAHYEALLDFYRYYQRHSPELTPTQSKEAADREIQVMTAEIEEEMLPSIKEPDMTIIEPKVYKTLDKRLKEIVKDDKPLHTAAVDNSQQPGLYGGFIGRHLISIAKLAKHADLITEAAIEDVKKGGTGHIFRTTLLRLGIPYVGPKIVSFAWLLLQPLTSQLATVDRHMAEVLGENGKDGTSNRDYFRMERELQAGRDASGYNHMPLGQFQWALWDHKRTGPGSHQDHTPLRAWEPVPHHQIEWKPRLPSVEKNTEWIPPEWWQATQPYREAETAKWNHDIAVKYPRNQIPWQENEIHVATAVEGTDDEVHLAIDVPEWVRKKIAEWTGTLDVEAEWLDPNDYHITVAYAEHGVEDIKAHEIRNKFNLTGLKFEGKRLTTFNDALVIELECPRFNDYATRVNDGLETLGIDVASYSGGYKPHITIAYASESAPSVSLPPLSFRGGEMSFSTPRGASPMPALTAYTASLWPKTSNYRCPVCNFNLGTGAYPDADLEDLFQSFCPNCGTDLSENRPMGQPASPQQNQMMLRPPLTVKKQTEDERNEYWRASYPDRIPIAWDTLDNILYIGLVGTYHEHMGQFYGIKVKEGEFASGEDLNDKKYWVGYITLPYYTDDSPGSPHYYKKPIDMHGAVMGWYRRTPTPEDEKMLEDAAGILPPREEEEKAKTDDEVYQDADDDGLWDDDDIEEGDIADIPDPQPKADLQKGDLVHFTELPQKWIQDYFKSETGDKLTLKHEFRIQTIYDDGSITLMELVDGVDIPVGKKDVHLLAPTGPAKPPAPDLDLTAIDKPKVGYGPNKKGWGSGAAYDLEDLEVDPSLTEVAQEYGKMKNLPIGTVFKTPMNDQAYEIVPKEVLSPAQQQVWKEGDTGLATIDLYTGKLKSAIPVDGDYPIPESWQFAQIQFKQNLQLQPKMDEPKGTVFNDQWSSWLGKYVYSPDNKFGVDPEQAYHVYKDHGDTLELQTVGLNNELTDDVIIVPKDEWQKLDMTKNEVLDGEIGPKTNAPQSAHAPGTLVKWTGDPDSLHDMNYYQPGSLWKIDQWNENAKDYSISHPDLGSSYAMHDNIAPVTDQEHAVFATTEDGQKYRVTPQWLNVNDAYDRWDSYDQVRMHNIQNQLAPPTVEGKPISFYSMRSALDPQWNQAPYAKHD